MINTDLENHLPKQFNSSPLQEEESIQTKTIKMVDISSIHEETTNKYQKLASNMNVYWMAKVLVISAMLCAVWLGKTYGSPSIEVEQLYDPIHDATQFLNHIVNKNRDISMAFQISASLIMDFSFFSLLIYWVLKIKSSRVIFALACFYVFRSINQALIIFPFPPGYYWENPSFPSYVTPYGKTSDFFYSGHVGFLNLMALEWHQQKRFFMFKLTCFFNIYIAFIMIIFRIHYVVDITTGLVVSHWLFMITQKYIDKIDSVFRFIYNWIEGLLENKFSNSFKLEDELQINR